MNHIIVAIRDSATESFGRPFFVAARGQAVRSFVDEVSRSAEDNPLHKHPSDFELYELGSFDDQTGSLVSQPPSLLMRGKDAALKAE